MKTLLAGLVTLAICSNLMAACEVVEGGAKKPFDGKIGKLEVEKKSLSILAKEFPALNAVEESFKGNITACTTCTDKYITCSN